MKAMDKMLLITKNLKTCFKGFSFCLLVMLLAPGSIKPAAAECGFFQYGNYVCGGAPTSGQKNYQGSGASGSGGSGGSYQSGGGPIFMPPAGRSKYGTPYQLTSQTTQFYSRSFGNGDFMTDGPNGTRAGISFYVTEPSKLSQRLDLRVVKGVGSLAPKITVRDSQGNVVFERTRSEIVTQKFMFTADGNPPPPEFFDDFTRRYVYDKDGNYKAGYIQFLKTNELYTFEPSASGEPGGLDEWGRTQEQRATWFRSYATYQDASR